MVVFSWETRLLTYILGPELFVSVPCAMTEEGTLDLAMQNTDMCQIYGHETVEIPCGDTLDFLYPFADREGSVEALAIICEPVVKGQEEHLASNSCVRRPSSMRTGGTGPNRGGSDHCLGG